MVEGVGGEISEVDVILDDTGVVVEEMEEVEGEGLVVVGTTTTTTTPTATMVEC